MKNHVTIIAEAGVNHNGDIRIAKKLIDVAAEAGVDYVKFQTFVADKLVSKMALKASYQQENMASKSSLQLDMLKKLELSKDDHIELISYCFSKKIKFLSTAFDLDSITLLFELGVRLFKIPSGEITNLPYLKKIAAYADEVIISTGMATLTEISDAVNALVEEGIAIDRIIILQCNTEYPTPMQDVNLLAMNSIAEQFKVRVGYSDHTMGIEVPIAAVALGATVIEKHFTLDRMMEGPDHLASLEPNQLSALVASIRNIELAISGNGKKEPSVSEKKNMAAARKSIHLLREIPAEQMIDEKDLIMLRPGDGISPMLIDKIVGRRVKHTLKAGTKLSESDLL